MSRIIPKMAEAALVALCLICSQSLFAQTRVQVGGVVSEADGTPVVGANVIEKGTMNGTMTGTDGRWMLTVPNGATLTVSCIGFDSQEITVNGARTNYQIVLGEDTSFLDEVVVVGYGVVKKSDLTSSISTIRGEDIVDMPSMNAMNSLQGKVNGVQISTAGSPGASPKVIIRGITTTNGTSPLYVVDGAPLSGGIGSLNDNDIESIEVLKDASAAAIYGTRGSNGVILVTTKKGVAGKPRIDFSTNFGLQHIPDPHMADAKEYEQVYKTRYSNDGAVDNWNGKNATNTNWWKEVVKPVALTQNYQFSVRGGSDRFIYNLSLGYTKQHSQFEKGFSDKFNIRLNTEYNLAKWIKLGFNLAPRLTSSQSYATLFTGSMSMDPSTPIYRPQEEWTDNEYSNFARSHNNQSYNPVGQQFRSDGKGRNYGIMVSPSITITPVKGLTFLSQFNDNAGVSRSDSFSPKFDIDSAHEYATVSTVSRNYSESFNWSTTNTLTYIGSFAKHNLTGMLGFTAERFASYDNSASREATPNDSDPLREVGAGTQTEHGGGSSSFNTLVSWLARVMYNYDNRYYLTATGRIDGSSRFPAGNKYAFFPSVSVAWRFSEEAFVKDNIPWLSQGKLRLGWGQVGNQSIPSNAPLTLLRTNARYAFGDGFLVGSQLSTVGNTNLRWETVEDYNLGLDLGFFRNKLNVTADIYKKTSHGMLYQKDNVWVLGYPNNLWENVGSMEAKGWEFSVDYKDAKGDWTYTVGLNLSGVRNRAIKFSGQGYVYSGRIESGAIYGENSIRNEDGMPISRFYLLTCDGIFQNQAEVDAHSKDGKLIQPNAQPGDLRIKDLNGDGVINEEDKSYVGDPYPDLMVGLNFSVSYKNWDLSGNFYGTFGNDVLNMTKNWYSGINGSNVFAGTLEKAWHGQGTGAGLPRLSYNDKNQNYSRLSTFFMEDGTYFRCKQLQLGYTFPRSLMKDVRLRLSLRAQNPFTLTKYSGMDPERPQYDGSALQTGIDNVAYPSPRTFMFGINLSF